MQSLLTKEGKENTGHKKVIMPIYDKGNLNALTWTQRMDVEFIEGDLQYSPKVGIKVGKADINSRGWKHYRNSSGELECPQEMRTSSLDTLKELHIKLWEAESLLRKDLAMPLETWDAARYEYMKLVTERLRR